MSIVLRSVWGVLSAALILGNCQAAAQHRRSVEMPEQIVKSLASEDEMVRKCVEGNGVRKTFKAEWVDLSKDDSSEMMVRGISPCVCGPRKCVNRVYRKTENGYELLFKADYAQEIEPLKYYTNGYRNLWAAVYTHGPLTSVLYEYHYDGEQYRWAYCAMRFYMYTKWHKGVAGPYRYHSRPSISMVGCDPRNP